MSNTQSTKRPRIIRPVAGGLYQTEGAKLYRFRDYSTDGELPARINIGRKRDCDIFLTDPTVSGLHAFLERRDGEKGHEMWIWNVADCYFDGHPIDEPRVLLVGMMLRFGDTRLIATDEEGRFPIAIYNVDEIYDHALDYHGSQRRAARHIGVSHTTMYRHVKKLRAERQECKRHQSAPQSQQSGERRQS